MMTNTSPDIFVHVPRTAGTSLREAAIRRHGADKVYAYGMTDDILLRADRQVYDRGRKSHKLIEKVVRKIPFGVEAALALRRNRAADPELAFAEAAAIIGHFSVDKFDNVPAARYSRKLTVVREPLGRMVSHYSRVRIDPLDNSRPRRMGWAAAGDPRATFAEFALSEPVRNFQTTYTGTDIGAFAVVGTTEHFADFLRRADLASADAPTPPHLNGGAHSVELAVLKDPGFVRDFQDFHADDYQFYQQAVSTVEQPSV